MRPGSLYIFVSFFAPRLVLVSLELWKGMKGFSSALWSQSHEQEEPTTSQEWQMACLSIFENV